MFMLGFAAVAFLILLLAGRYLGGLNSKDMGTMSERWLAEYNAQHP